MLIDSDALLDTLENYLRKHGYCATLYDGLKSCPQDRHVHELCDTDYIAHLIGRAEPELAGGCAILVLTCLGIHLWERLHRLWQKLRAEEQTWQMLFYLGVAVEEKQGIITPGTSRRRDF
ncbi:unnamed protein product [Pocillopora meandrina]|uniref:Uncharacterized protein n=1 Tax=Pocillopora meandrina TaxID=46732 RepID=A0AAU9WDC5_9CNID|nr:unnamed protein product [Pocillopora meandrina]